MTFEPLMGPVDSDQVGIPTRAISVSLNGNEKISVPDGHVWNVDIWVEDHSKIIIEWGNGLEVPLENDDDTPAKFDLLLFAGFTVKTTGQMHMGGYQVTGRSGYDVLHRNDNLTDIEAWS